MQANVTSYSAEQMQFSILASSESRRWRGLEASLYDISPGISERPPGLAHSLVLHLSSAVEGTCRCEGPLLRRVIQPGDIDFIPFGYAATWHDKGGGRVANVRIAPALMREMAEAMGHGGDAFSFPPRLSLNDPVLRSLALTIVAELESGDDGAIFAESVACAIATHLLRRYADRSLPPATRGLSRAQLARIAEYIDGNLATSLSLSSIAAMAGISASHLKTLFKRSFGVPVHQYVIRRRVDRAIELLGRDGARLCDVAQQTGFSDQSHMARCIRRIVGATPASIARDLA